MDRSRHDDWAAHAVRRLLVNALLALAFQFEQLAQAESGR